MVLLRIFIFIQFISLQVFAQTLPFVFSPNKTIDYVRKSYSCTKVAVFGCQTNPDSALRSLVEICNDNLAKQGCNEFEQSNPELSENMKRCDQRSVCSEAVDPGFMHLKGCVEGLGEGAWDGLKSLVIDLPTSAAEFAAYDAIQTEKYYDWEKKCETSLSCKKELVSVSGDFKNLSDAELSQIQVRYLYPGWVREIKNQGYALERFQTPESWNKSDKALQSKISMAALYEKARDEVKKLNLKLQCFDEEAQAELLCYGVGQVLGYGGIAKTALKIPSIAKYVGEATAVVQSSRVVTKLHDVVHVYTPKTSPFVFGPKARGPPTDSEFIGPTISRRERVGSAADRQATHAITARQEVKDTFLRKYTDPVIPYTTVEQNSQWIKIAASKNPANKYKFFEIENAEMKLANDTLGDKNFVTALTNLHKEIVFKKIDELLKKNPGLEMAPYSDFKSCRFAFSGKVPADLETQLNKLYKEVHAEFLGKEFSSVKVKDLISKDISAESWFRAGIGESADQASLASRASRSLPPGAGAISFADESVQLAMNKAFQETRDVAQQVQNKLGSTKLMSQSNFNPGTKSLNADVYDVLKKFKGDNQAIRKVIKQKYGYDIQDSEIALIQKMQSSADIYSPGIHIPERVNSNLRDAAHGGFTADFAGMGSQNTKGTVDAILSAKNPNEAILAARENEKVVTTLFNSKKLEFETRVQKAIESTQKKPPKIMCSGDDGAVCTAELMTNKEIQNVMTAMAQSERPADLRMAFVEPTIQAEMKDRMSLAGELTEKFLRKELSQTLPADKLEQTVFGVAIDQAGPRLYQGTKSGVQYTADQLKLIEDAFVRATKKAQEELLK